MTTPHYLEIPLNKSKIILMLIGASAFVAIGFWFVIDPPEIRNTYWGHPTKLTIIGYAAIVFFGICAVVLLRKIPDSKPGLILDNIGLVDNSGGLSAGLILWKDIENISVLTIQKQKMLMLQVNNPQEYIDKQTSWIKRKSMTLNYKMYGTPICISANGLNIPFQELYTLITEKFHEQKSIVVETSDARMSLT